MRRRAIGSIGVCFAVALLSACQPPALTIGNETDLRLRVVEETTGENVVALLVPGSTASVRITAMVDDGCATSWKLVALDMNGNAVNALDAPCPTTWKITSR